MDEYQLQDAFHSNIAMVQTYFFAFISTTSVLLVVAHLAANELSPNVVKLAVSPYGFTALFYIGNFQRAFATGIAISRKMVDANMTWHAAVLDSDLLLPILM